MTNTEQTTSQPTLIAVSRLAKSPSTHAAPQTTPASRNSKPQSSLTA
jgi:hypothetical protein